MHPTSLTPLISKLNLENTLPQMSCYNANQSEINKVAAYVMNLSDRLSIPKMSSNGSKAKLD